MTCETYLKDWLALRSAELKPRTVEDYQDLIRRHIAPAIGSIKLKKLSAKKIKHMLASIAATGHTRTAEACYVLLVSALEDAPGKPMQNIKRPAHRQKSPPAWKDDNIAAYMAALVNHRHRLPLTLCITLGLRRGEVCGLRWQDIDFQAQMIHIVNQRQRIGKLGIVDCPPKTESSVRDIPIPDDLMPLLRSYRQIAGYICSITPSALDKAHRTLVMRLGLTPYTTLHGLRHSIATSCIRHGGSMKGLQLLLGHANYATTANKYTQPDMDMIRSTLDVGIHSCYTVLR